VEATKARLRAGQAGINEGGVAANAAPAEAAAAAADAAAATAAKEAAAAKEEEARGKLIDTLVAQATPALRSHARLAFGEAELRALAGLFADLDHDRDGALTLAEFRLLLTLLSERAAGRDGAAQTKRAATITTTGETAKAEPTRGGTRRERPASIALGLRDAYSIFRQLDLDASGGLSFAELLRLLASDDSIGQTALAEARDPGGWHLKPSGRRADAFKGQGLGLKQQKRKKGTGAKRRAPAAAGRGTKAREGAAPTGARPMSREPHATRTRRGELRLMV